MRPRPFEVVREVVAGMAGGTAFLISHWALAFPHWQLPAVDVALEFAVALGIYAGVRLAWTDRPGRLERWLGLDIPLRLELGDQDAESLRQALHFTADAARPRLTEPVREALARVVAAVESVLAVWDRCPLGGDAAHTVRASVTDYLPDMLERYLSLPRRYAIERRVRGSQTPRDLLLDQLGVLAEELEAIADDIHAGNASDLAAHGRFLQQRFGRNDPLRTED